MARPKPLPHFVSWRFPTTANGRPFFSGSILAGRAVGHDLLVDGIFSAKTLIAAILAYYIALASQLERPYWSVITCYIVAQPLTGALMSKGVYRMMGTVIGAAVAIVMVPNLVDAPELLVLALALWLGTCTYVAALDRTPRSYVSLLAGYSAIIVAIPTVNAPETVFDVAIARVQEIGIGIACVSVVHALLFPKPVWHQVRDRLDRILEDAQVWSNEALAIPPRPEEVIWRDRRKLAADLHDLHLLSTHLPYDMTSPAIVPDMLREAEMQLGLLLPLASAVEDRIVALGEGGAQDLAGHGRLGALIEAVRVWIAKGAQQDPSALIARAHALEPDLETPESWAGLVQLSLLDRLTGLIQAHAAARALRDRLLDQAPAYPGQVRKAASPPQGELFPVSRRALHRDHRVAMRAAAATMLTVLITCAIWIATAWTDAGSAVVTAAIICALFSHLDAPLRAARHVFYGTIGAVLAAGLAAFLMIPHVTDFAGLCVMIAPFLLVMGWLFARPQRAPFGVGAVLIFPGLAGLDIAYESVFDTFVNQAGALMTGSFLACLVLSAVRATGAGTAALRLARAGWQELATKTQPRTTPQTTAWISRMLDRMVLLGPHVATLGNGDALTCDRLRDIRIGMALDDLQRVGQDAGLRQARRSAVLSARLRKQFLSARKTGVLEVDQTLCRMIERALASANRLPASPAKRSLLLALVGLSRNLSP